MWEVNDSSAPSTEERKKSLEKNLKGDILKVFGNTSLKKIRQEAAISEDDIKAQEANYAYFRNARTIDPIDMGVYCSPEPLEEHRKVLRHHA